MDTDQAGNTEGDVTYYPWGQVWQGGGSNGDAFGDLEFQINYPLPPSATRDYNQTLGRWMTPDPGGRKVVKLDNPQTWNMYAYVTDNPTTLNDPSGLQAADQGAEGVCTNRNADVCNGNQQAQQPNAGHSLSERLRAVWAAYHQWTQANRAQFAAKHPTLTWIERGLVIAAAYSDLGGEDPEAMLGSEGAQFSSKTLWTEGEARIDVENPAPGRRPGMIHFQEGPEGSTQYIYDIKTGEFKGLSVTKNRELLANPRVQAAIQKALKYLGK